MLPPKKNLSSKKMNKVSTISSNTKVINGHSYDVNDAKDFYDKMLGSNWYKERLLNNGYGLKNPDAGIIKTKVNTIIESNDDQEYKVNNLVKDRRKGIRNVNLTVNPKENTYFLRNGVKDPYINLGAGQLDNLKAHPRSAYVHELGHAETDSWYGTDISGYEKETYSKTAKPINTIKSEDGHYTLNPKEAKSDINTIRYNLYKKGDFNPSTGEYKTKDKKFNKTLLPKIKNDYNSKRMIDTYGEEGVSKLMNTIAKNTNNNSKQYMAMGGIIRPSSRNRHIAPMVIAAGVQAGIGLVGSFLGMGAADKARREQIKQIAEQERNAQALQRTEQKRNDTVLYNKTNLEGDSTVQYYAEGGELNPLASTQQPMVGRAINNTSLAGYATKGGNLVQIGDGVEEARGNKHNETKIDGVSGIQLHPEGAPEPIAEIEDKEILVDGNKVLSQQLKYKGNQSYADKMRQIVKNRNKLEKEQLETKSTRKKNTVERKLAGLNMAEETLFKMQEAHKELEGTQVLDKLKSFAMGGTIGEPIISEGKYKGWTKTAKGFYRHPSNKNVIVDENGNPKYNYELEKQANMFGVKSVTPNQTPIPVNTPTLPAPSTNSVPAPIIVPPPSAAAMPGQIAPPASTTNQPSKLEGFLSSSTGQGIIGALPGIASGIGAYIMAGNTPPLPKPLLNRAETLETRVNVNPQLANIRGTVKASVDNILQNTSSSNNAKQNIASVRLKGAAEVNNVLNNKENTETQLKNADSQNRQMVANANTATLNQHGMNQYQRLNDIRTMKSAGFAHITGAIQNGINIKRTADNFDAYTKANLADDKLGEKVGLYMNDRNFMANPSNRETVISILNTKTSDGQYKYPFDRANAIKKGLITE